MAYHFFLGIAGCGGVEVFEESYVVQVRGAFIEAELFAKFVELLFGQVDAVLFEYFLQRATQLDGQKRTRLVGVALFETYNCSGVWTMSGREFVYLLKVTLELGPVFDDEWLSFADELKVHLLLLKNWLRRFFGKRSTCQAGEELARSFNTRPRLQARISIVLFDPLILKGTKVKLGFGLEIPPIDSLPRRILSFMLRSRLNSSGRKNRRTRFEKGIVSASKSRHNRTTSMLFSLSPLLETKQEKGSNDHLDCPKACFSAYFSIRSLNFSLSSFSV